MEKNGYHHGDLRRSLIETGIELISHEGEENISLRKVAAKCGVSNASPYAHFKNKDEFIMAIQQYVMDLFTTSLEETATKYENTSEILPMLGKTYVMFFYHNPLYYDFLFSRKNIKIMLSMDSNGETENQPLEILKNAAMKTLSRTDMTTKMIQDKTIAMWALVHGLANIVTMPNVEYDDNWESRIEEIIKAISISPTMKENGK